MLIGAAQDKAEARVEPRRAEGQHDGLSTLGRHPLWRRSLEKTAGVCGEE